MDDRVLHDFLVESIPLWQQNPVQFFEEVLSFYPDEWQKEAAFATLKPLPKEHRSTGVALGLLLQLLHSQSSLKTTAVLQLQILSFQHPVQI